MMRRATLIVLMSAFFGSFAPAGPAAAAQPGCVDLLTDCFAGAGLLTSVCGPGVQPLSSPVSDNISYVVFGSGVQNVTLTECGSGAKFVITGDQSLCELDDTNDNVCAIELTIGQTSAAPALSGAGLGIIILALLTMGGIRLRRRSRQQSTETRPRRV
jgi:hypothetical protein